MDENDDMIENEDFDTDNASGLAEVKASTEADSVDDESGTNQNAKEEERKRLEADIEAFLAKGGKIDHIEANVMADPPKKPTSNYGGQPI